MSLTVGLLRAQRDGNRPHGIVQNDIVRRGALSGFDPACAQTGLDLVKRGDARLVGLCRALHFGGVAGIGGSAIERTVLPVGQYDGRIAKVTLPRPSGDGGKPLFRHRKIDDSAQIETVRRRLRVRALRKHGCRQTPQCNSQDCPAGWPTYFRWHDFMHMSYSLLQVFAE